MPSRYQFTCAPHSICLKNKTVLPRRSTYCAIRGADSKISLQCISSPLRIDLENSDTAPSTITKYLPSDKTPIHLEASPLKASDGVLLFVVFQDGDIAAYTDDLASATWIERQRKSKLEPRYATTFNVHEARNGILKGREDLLSRVETTSAASRMLFLIEQASGEGKTSIEVTIVASFDHAYAEGKSSPWVCEILGTFSVELPDSMPDITGCFVHRSGWMYAWHQRQLAVTELTGLPSKMKLSLSLGDTIHSCLRLSPNFVVFSEGSSLKVVDIKHLATRSDLSLLDTVLSGEQTDDTPPLVKPIHLLISKSNPAALVFRSGRYVYTINTADLILDEGTGRHQSTLANAIEKGINTRHNATFSKKHDLGVLGKTLEYDGNFSSETNKFTANLSAEQLDHRFEKMIKKISGGIDAQDGFTGPAASPLTLSKAREIISLAICRIFATTSRFADGNHQKSLTLRFMPSRTFEWLVKHRLILQHQVERALKHNAYLALVETLRPCAMIEALATYDHSLQTLMLVLNSPTPLGAREIAFAIGSVTTLIQQSRTLSGMKSIRHTEMDLGSESDSVEVGEAKGLSTGPRKDADRIDYAQAAVKVCVTQLGLHHEQDVRSAFTQELSPIQLETLLNYLRAELAGGGWLSHIIHDSASPGETTQDASQIVLLTRMMSCAMDALCTGSWFHSAFSEEQVETISSIKSEISAALEAAEGATYMQGFLHEALLFTKHLPEQQLLTGRNTDVIRPVTIMGNHWEENALPLGLKPRNHIEHRVVKNGREKTRSKREMGGLKSKLVMPYSVDRIVL